jgi:hypothetical protein
MEKQAIHPARSAIPAQLISAYRATGYRVMPPASSASRSGEAASASGREFILHIDEYSRPLSQLFADSGYRCAAFITASNPFSEPHGVEENLAACARLRDELLRRSCRAEHILNGEGRDITGTWPGEKSFLVLGLDLETSRQLGREFRQNAVVWVDEDAIPRLILLR